MAHAAAGGLAGRFPHGFTYKTRALQEPGLTLSPPRLHLVGTVPLGC